MRRPRGVPIKRELVELATEACPTISIDPPPLVHVTSVGWGRRIVDSGFLAAQPCGVFNEELVYTFLARPAYRFKRGGEKTEQINLFPFAIVLSPEALPSPYHVYPFDTGAYVAGIYDKVLDPSLYLEDYELEPSLASALRHLEWAFDTINYYFDAKIKTGLAETLPEWRSVGRRWIAIASLASKGRHRLDDRASAIEIAFTQSINLRQGHAKLLVFPQQLLEDPRGTNTEFKERLRNLNIPFATYEWRPNEAPDSYADEIADVVRQHIQLMVKS